MNKKLKKGDVVKTKLGTQKMTVEEVTPNYVKCSWTDPLRAGKSVSGKYKAEMLVVV